MKTRALIWSAIALSTAGFGIPMAWRNAQHEPPPEPLDRPAEGPLDEELTFASAFGDAAAPEADPAVAAAAGASDAAPADVDAAADVAAGGESDGTSLEASLARLERLLPRSGRRELDRLARGGAVPDAAAVAGEAPGSMLLDAFLAENPLCGVLRAGDGSTALFGLRALRSGEAFLDGRARVRSVDVGGVTLEVDGRARQVDLPPLSPRAPTRATEGRADGSSEVQP